jgi:hypothetical protein
MRLRRTAAMAVAVPLALVFGLGDAFAGAAELAAHRAMYTLKLDDTHSGNVAAANGEMAYEVLDACDGWATRQRLEMAITNHDGQDIRMISEYTTWESKDGLKMRFHMKQTTDQAVTSEVAGDASLTGTGKSGTAHFTSPEDSTKELPAGTLFPMMHTAALLAAASEGKKFLAVPLFDGTTATGAQDSSIVIGAWHPPEASRWPGLSTLPSGKFHIAFFDRGPENQQPDYEVSMRYWDNGVADDLAMDFGDFVMDGKLAEFKLLPEKC